MGDTVSGKNSSFTVVIDAGHGGFDSGKVGVDGTLEKDVNLKIAKKLEKLLTAADVNVIMTRTEDTGLYSESSSNKKREDMAARVERMNKPLPDCIVSIHQNSYPEESIDGAQVFYYTGSDAGKTLAALIQDELITDVDPSNHRTEKSNSSYYLLKNASAPIVIVECGFLSNWAESKKLVDDAYQQKLAWAIHMGILQFLNQ
ncbi:MAG: N-acetylmuramoyl-L-alanine amidase [Lachnospiraceae bacterium]|nr:N-acetylmuramoyl-L-alanine amidase [Lachnospiraceae bacterium]